MTLRALSGVPPRGGTDPCGLFQESIAPLFEVHMELGEFGLVFNPSLEVGAEHGFLELIESLINDIYNVAKLIPRLAKGRLNYKVSLASFGPTCFPCLGTRSAPGSEAPPSSAGLVPACHVMVAQGPGSPDPAFLLQWLLLRGPGFYSPGPAHPRRTPRVCPYPSLVFLSLL